MPKDRPTGSGQSYRFHAPQAGTCPQVRCSTTNTALLLLAKVGPQRVAGRLQLGVGLAEDKAHQGARRLAPIRIECRDGDEGDAGLPRQPVAELQGQRGKDWL